MSFTRSEKAVRPITTIQINCIEASLWQNETDDGLAYKATFKRLYTDRHGKTRSTNSFGAKHLPHLARAIEILSTEVLTPAGQLGSSKKKCRESA